MNAIDFVKELETTLDGVPVGSLALQTRFRELPTWDSLAALTTIAAVDSVFGVQITGNQLRGCHTIQDIVDVALSQKR